MKTALRSIATERDPTVGDAIGYAVWNTLLTALFMVGALVADTFRAVLAGNLGAVRVYTHGRRQNLSLFGWRRIGSGICGFTSTQSTSRR